jgi:hypothetical protein
MIQPPLPPGLEWLLKAAGTDQGARLQVLGDDTYRVTRLVIPPPQPPKQTR